MSNAIGNLKYKVVLTLKTIKQFVFSNAFLCYFFILLLLFTSGFMITFTVLPSFFMTLSYVIFFIAGALTSLFKIKTIKNNVKSYYRQNILSLAFVLVFCFSCFLSFLFNKEFANINYYVQIVLLVLNGLLLSNIFSLDFFYKKLSNVFFIVCVISLIIFVLYRLSGLINFSPFGYVYNSNGLRFSNFLITFIGGRNRLQGPFWEPGLFASFILIISSFDILFFKKINYIKLAFYFICIVCTLSTFAFLCMPIVVILIIKKSDLSKKVKIISICSIALMLLLGAIFYNDIARLLSQIMPSIFGKLSGKEGAISLTTRLYSPYIDLLIFVKNPFVGKGLYGADMLYSAYLSTDFRGIVDSQTSTSFRFAAQLGIFGFSYTAFIVLAFAMNKRFRTSDMLFLSILFILIINKEPHTQILFTIVLPFYLSKMCFDKGEEVHLL